MRVPEPSRIENVMEVPAAMLAVQVMTPAALCSGKFWRAAAPLWPPGRMLMKYGACPPRKAMATGWHWTIEGGVSICGPDCAWATAATAAERARMSIMVARAKGLQGGNRWNGNECDKYLVERRKDGMDRRRHPSTTSREKAICVPPRTPQRPATAMVRTAARRCGRGPTAKTKQWEASRGFHRVRNPGSSLRVQNS